MWMAPYIIVAVGEIGRNISKDDPTFGVLSNISWKVQCFFASTTFLLKDQKVGTTLEFFLQFSQHLSNLKVDNVDLYFPKMFVIYAPYESVKLSPH